MKLLFLSHHLNNVLKGKQKALQLFIAFLLLLFPLLMYEHLLNAVTAAVVTGGDLLAVLILTYGIINAIYAFFGNSYEKHTGMPINKKEENKQEIQKEIGQGDSILPSINYGKKEEQSRIKSRPKDSEELKKDYSIVDKEEPLNDALGFKIKSLEDIDLTTAPQVKKEEIEIPVHFFEKEIIDPQSEKKNFSVETKDIDDVIEIPMSTTQDHLNQVKSSPISDAKTALFEKIKKSKFPISK